MAKVLTVAESQVLDSIGGALIMDGHNVVSEASWIKALERIRTEVFDALITDSNFLCGNRGEPTDPTVQLIEAAKERGISKVVVATPLAPINYDKIWPETPTVELLGLDIKAKVRRVLEQLDL